MTDYFFEAINRTNRRVDAAVKLLKSQKSKTFWTRVALVTLAVKVCQLSREVEKLKEQEEGE